MAAAVLTSKGQVTIPKEIRERLGVQQGDRIEFVEMGPGEFAVKAATLDIRRLKGTVPKPPRPVTVDAMNRAVRRRAVRR